MKKYILKIDIDGELTEIIISTVSMQEAIEECWRMYGQSCYIESIRLSESDE